MSSILTNTSAMVALQTLNSINKNLSTVQSEISTGKSVASAKDNSAVWAISQVMQSDVDGFNAISDSLSLGQSTVAVGRNAAESVTNLLSQVKEKVVAAQEDNVDREKLQTDLASLRDQISGIVGAAQFNGQNLLSNTSTTAVRLIFWHLWIVLQMVLFHLRTLPLASKIWVQEQRQQLVVLWLMPVQTLSLRI